MIAKTCMGFFIASALLSQLMLIGSAGAQGGSAFFLELYYENDTFSLQDVFVRSSGPAENVAGDGPFVYEILSFDGDVLYSSRFSPPRIEHSDGPVYATNINRELFIVAPYYPNSAEIRMMNGVNETMLVVNVTSFASERPIETAVAEPPYLGYAATAAVALVVCFALYFLFFHRRSEDAFGSLKKKWS